MKYIKIILACLFVAFSGAAYANQGDKAIILASAARMGISRPVIEKVAGRESGFNCHAYNRSSGASGPLQILPSSARALGYNASGAALRSCGVGLTAGLKHLRACVDVVGQNPARAAYCHNFGLGAVTHKKHYAYAHKRYRHYAHVMRSHRRHYAMR